MFYYALNTMVYIYIIPILLMIQIRDDVQNLLRTFNEIAACASRDLQDFLNQHSRILPPFASVNMSSNPLMRLQEVQNDVSLFLCTCIIVLFDSWNSALDG
jgi:hypothetical protein